MIVTFYDIRDSWQNVTLTCKRIRLDTVIVVTKCIASQRMYNFMLSVVTVYVAVRTWKNMRCAGRWVTLHFAAWSVTLDSTASSRKLQSHRHTHRITYTYCILHIHRYTYYRIWSYPSHHVLCPDNLVFVTGNYTHCCHFTYPNSKKYRANVGWGTIARSERQNIMTPLSTSFTFHREFYECRIYILFTRNLSHHVTWYRFA